jgi:hypothetical protein
MLDDSDVYQPFNQPRVDVIEILNQMQFHKFGFALIP